MLDIRRHIDLIESASAILRESVEAVHRTSAAGAEAIRRHGFSLEHFGTGAGAGSGEPAGVYLSVGDGADFSREVDRRSLGLDAVVRVRVHANNILQWDRDARLAFFKEARLAFVQERFGISPEDATAVIRYQLNVMRQRPDLDRIATWLDTREGERDLALYLNQRLRQEGYDAVQYRDPWQGVEQMIVLDPAKVEVLP